VVSVGVVIVLTAPVVIVMVDFWFKNTMVAGVFISEVHLILIYNAAELTRRAPRLEAGIATLVTR
jgi:hypothetical protein